VKTWTLRITVALALVAAAFLFRGRQRLPETPEAAVTALFDAAGKGDDRAYLELVGGELSKSLENTRKELGAAAFRESLRRSNTGMKGLAVTRAADSPPGMVAMSVELVFADRIDRQRMILTETTAGWTITAIEAVRLVKPPVPYGTPVFEEPPPAQPSAPQPKKP